MLLSNASLGYQFIQGIERSDGRDDAEMCKIDWKGASGPETNLRQKGASVLGR